MGNGVEVIHNTVQKARKEYSDDSYEFILGAVDNIRWANKGVFSFADLRILVAVKQRRREARMILPGDTYVRQRNKVDGDVFTFKAKQEYHRICCKYDLYPEI